jgi:hypothetical protein
MSNDSEIQKIEPIDFKKLPRERAEEINRQLDNFFEVVFLVPHEIDPKVIRFLSERERELGRVRHLGWLVGGTTVGALYYFYRYKYNLGFFFKNFVRMTMIGAIGAYFCGRYFEYYHNDKKFKPTLVQIATEYNVTDEEVMNLHNQANEMFLKQKQEEEHRKFSLDKVKIKF